VELSFDLSEDPANPPAVTLAGRAFTLSSSAGGHSVYAYTPDGSEPEGDQVVTVEGEDSAGNAFEDSVTLRLDFTAPTLLSSSVSPDHGMIGDPVTLTFTVSEPLAVTPVVTLGSGPMDLVNESGSTYIFGRDLQAADPEGELPISIDLEDEVGNSSTETLAGPVADFTPPSVSSASIDPNPAGSGDHVTVSFTSSEELSGNPVVTLGTRSMVLESHSVLAYTYGLDLAGTETEGTQSVTIELEDLAGNTTQDATLEIVLDFTDPAITAISVDPVFARSGDVATVAFTISESVPADPVVTLGGRAAQKTSQDGLAVHLHPHSRWNGA